MQVYKVCKKTMETLEQRIEKATELSFSHNRNTVDVVVFDNEGEVITKIRDCSAELFLEHFDYGMTICDDVAQIMSFLKAVI